MIRYLAAASALLALSACQYDKEGVFVVYLPPADDLECQDTINENITDADPPEEQTTETTWVFSEEGTVSDGAVMVQVFESKDGQVLLDWAGTLYTGTSEGGVITVSWTNSNDTVETASNADSGYSWTESDNTTVENTITLTKNKETKGYSGNWKSTVSTVYKAEESDEWDPTQDYYYFYPTGQIGNAIFQWLDGGASNHFEMVDCDSDPCFVEVTSTCSGSYNFEMVETDLDADAYNGIKNSGQPQGV